MTAGPPRLAVVTDVPVARTVGGSVLLHRLLTGYPADRVRVVQSQLHPWPTPDQRLPGVEYRRVWYPVPRVLRNKFDPLWPVVGVGIGRAAAGACNRAVADFAPEAVLTVGHDYLWPAAEVVARRRRIPLHLICHDDWPTTAMLTRGGLPRRVSLALGRAVFGRTYRRAVSRLVVSPGMEERYTELYRVPSTLLYPSRGDDSPVPAVRVGRVPPHPPVAGYVGGLVSQGAVDLTRALADLLAGLGGRLDLYPGGLPGWAGPGAKAVRNCGYRPPKELAEVLAAAAHFLFLPGSFRPDEYEHFSTLFPSKLADYTAIGLPILIWAPAGSSAGRWGLANPDAAVTVTTDDPEAVREAALKLAADGGYAARVAAAGVAAGSRDFDPARTRSVLYHALGGTYG